MNLESYMLRKLLAICAKAEADNPQVTREVLSMVEAESIEVVNDIRAKIKGAIGVLPTMPLVAVMYKEGRIRVTVDTGPWSYMPPEEERSEWEVDEEDEE